CWRPSCGSAGRPPAHRRSESPSRNSTVTVFLLLFVGCKEENADFQGQSGILAITVFLALFPRRPLTSVDREPRETARWLSSIIPTPKPFSKMQRSHPRPFVAAASD